MLETIYRFFYSLLKDQLGVQTVSLFSPAFINETGNEPVIYPLVLVQILPSISTALPEKTQQFNVNVTLHVISEIYTTFKDSDSMIDTSFAHLSLLDKLYKQFEGKTNYTISDDENPIKYYINKIHRSAIDTGTDFGRRRRATVTFNFLFADSSMVKDDKFVQFSDVNDFETNIELKN